MSGSWSEWGRWSTCSQVCTCTGAMFESALSRRAGRGARGSGPAPAQTPGQSTVNTMMTTARGHRAKHRWCGGNTILNIWSFVLLDVCGTRPGDLRLPRILLARLEKDQQQVLQSGDGRDDIHQGVASLRTDTRRLPRLHLKQGRE